jgi:hypothetical protein
MKGFRINVDLAFYTEKSSELSIFVRIANILHQIEFYKIFKKVVQRTICDLFDDAVSTSYK